MNIINTVGNNGFRYISLDLIYGLPHQTPPSSTKTLREVSGINPDQLSVLN